MIANVGESRYLGSVITYEEKGILYQVSFSCEEIVDDNTGIKLAKVTGLKILDGNNNECSTDVDIEQVYELCLEKAIDTIVRHTPPDFL